MSRAFTPVRCEAVSDHGSKLRPAGGRRGGFANRRRAIARALVVGGPEESPGGRGSLQEAFLEAHARLLAEEDAEARAADMDRTDKRLARAPRFVGDAKMRQDHVLFG